MFKVYYLQKSIIRGAERNLYHIFDPTPEGIWTSSKRCSRIFFSSLAYKLNFYWILKILKLWENSFFGIFKSKLLLSLPHFLGILNQNLSIAYTFLFNMDIFLICTYCLISLTRYLLPDTCTWYMFPDTCYATYWIIITQYLVSDTSYLVLVS